MNIKKYAFIAIGMFFLIVLLAVGISARFSLSNITADPYQFIDNFFNQWSPALSAAGIIIVAALAISSIFESRRSEERRKQQAIHALHDEIHSNITDIITLRYQISEYLNTLKKHPETKDFGLSKGIEDSLFREIDTTVFDSMKNAGQLHWLDDMRMDIVATYKIIKMYNQHGRFYPTHAKVLDDIFGLLDKAFRKLEANFKFLPHDMKKKNSGQQTEVD